MPQACDFSCLYSLPLIYLLILDCSRTEGAGSGKCSGIWAALSLGTLSCPVTPGCSIHIPLPCSLPMQNYNFLYFLFLCRALATLLLLLFPTWQGCVTESQWQSSVLCWLCCLQGSHQLQPINTSVVMAATL